jgi:hypothetical protein
MRRLRLMKLLAILISNAISFLLRVIREQKLMLKNINKLEKLMIRRLN